MHRMSTLLQQLEQLAPLAATATAGPWRATVTAIVHSTNGEMCWARNGYNPHLGINIKEDADAAFIAAARNLLTPENLALLIAQQAAPVAGWIAVGDGLPDAQEGYTEFSPWVLAYTTAGRQIEATYYITGRVQGWYSTTKSADVTHWMPLPTPPADAA